MSRKEAKMKEDVIEMKKLVKEAQLEEQSLAMSLIAELKKANKRIFTFGLTISLVLAIMLTCSIGYIVYLLNDISYVETDTIDIQEVETIDGSNIHIGE